MLEIQQQHEAPEAHVGPSSHRSWVAFSRVKGRCRVHLCHIGLSALSRQYPVAEVPLVFAPEPRLAVGPASQEAVGEVDDSPQGAIVSTAPAFSKLLALGCCIWALLPLTASFTGPR